MQENSSNENTKRTKQEEKIIESVSNYVRFKWGISDWSAKVMVQDIIEQYIKIKENKW